MTIFGALGFVPAAIVAEKVLESALRGIEGMLQERQIPERRIPGSETSNRRVGFHKLFLAQLLQQYCKSECASIVVGGVSLSTVRDREDRVLQHSSVVGQRVDLIEF